MSLLDHALRGAARGPARADAAQAVRAALVVGAGGPLGSALLERALGSGAFSQVWAATTGPVAPALRGFVPLDAAQLAAAGITLPALAFVVFDRTRHSNGRDDVFHRPDPAGLPALAAQLQAGGVRRLVVVQPHTAAMLPQALRAGLASLDEAALAAQGFEHLVLLRAAAAPPAGAGALLRAPQRLARWMLSQLHWMVPQREQPVRSSTVATLAVALARALPAGRTGPTRVVPADLAWRAAQVRDVDALAAAWLAGEALPEPRFTPPRL